MSIGSTIHSQLRSTVYETLASLSSLGQGERDQRSGRYLRAHPTLTQSWISFAALASRTPGFLQGSPRAPLLTSCFDTCLGATSIITTEVEVGWSLWLGKGGLCGNCSMQVWVGSQSCRSLWTTSGP